MAEPKLAEESAPGLRPALDEGAKKAVIAGGSVLGAVAMSSCCIVPLALFSLGISGAWIGNLTALYPYKPYFFAVTAVFLGLGFWRVYRRPRACASEGGYCATPRADRVLKVALWGSTVIVIAALTFPYYAPWMLGL